MFGIPLFDLAWLVVALLAAGAITGLLAGVFGVGGGAVAVPILYELFRILEVPEEVRMPLCVGTSLAIIIPTSLRSFSAHKAKGAVDMTILRVWAVPVVLGVAIGSVIARYAPADLFKWVFVIVAGISAIRLLFGKDSWRLGLDMPAKPIMIAYGWLIGILSAPHGHRRRPAVEPVHDLLQPADPSGGRHLLRSRNSDLDPRRPRLHLCRMAAYREYPNVIAFQPPLALGYVSLLGFVLFIPTSTWMAPIGARLAHRLSKRRLEVAFGIFLLLVCARFSRASSLKPSLDVSLSRSSRRQHPWLYRQQDLSTPISPGPDATAGDVSRMMCSPSQTTGWRRFTITSSGCSPSRPAVLPSRNRRF